MTYTLRCLRVWHGDNDPPVQFNAPIMDYWEWVGPEMSAIFSWRRDMKYPGALDKYIAYHNERWKNLSTRALPCPT